MEAFERTDGELLGDFAESGCEAAFDAVVRRHGPMVAGVCRRGAGCASDADDAAQAVFVELACNAHGLRGRRSVAGWLHRTAWHVTLRARRAAATRQRLERLRPVTAGRGAADDADAVMDAEALRELDRALGMLPDDYREALVLHHLEGMTVAQVAELLGCPPGTAAARLSRGRSMLRERLRWRGLLLVVASHELSAAFTGGVADARAASPAEPQWHGEGLGPVDAGTPVHGIWETGGGGADAGCRPLPSAPVGRSTTSAGGTVAKAAAVSPSAPLPAALPAAAAGGAFVPIAGVAAAGGRFAVALAIGMVTTTTAAAGTMGYRAWSESRAPAPARVTPAGGPGGFAYRPAPPVVPAHANGNRPTAPWGNRPTRPEHDSSGGGAIGGPVAVTPEPSSLVLLGVGALALLRRRPRSQVGGEDRRPCGGRCAQSCRVLPIKGRDHMCKQSKSLSVPTYILAAALAFAISGPAAAAPNPIDNDGLVKKQGASLADVLERVKVAASGEEWKKEGWTDPLVEQWLGDVIKAVQAAGHGKELPEPVDFADYGRREPRVRPGPNPDAPPRPGEGALVVTRRLDVPRLRQTIALVDGDATVGFANDCVIIARGSVRVAHGSGNIIVAGRFIHVSHDGSGRSSAARRREMEAMAAARGQPRPERPVPPGAQRPILPMSLLVSGGVLDVSHAGGTVCAGLRRVEIAHALECVFVNSPNVQTSHRTDCAEVMLDKAVIGAPPEPHPLEADLQLHSATDHTVIFFFKGRRYVGEKGKPITDEAGTPVPELVGWTLSVAESGHAVLNNDNERASILLERRAER